MCIRDRIIRELCREHGVTVVLLTHHMNETIDADRLVVMEDGSIAMDAAPREVFCHVEELRSRGLAVPSTTELLFELNQCGFHLPLEALSVEECAAVIYEQLR